VRASGRALPLVLRQERQQEDISERKEVVDLREEGVGREWIDLVNRGKCANVGKLEVWGRYMFGQGNPQDAARGRLDAEGRR